ncbi:BclA C-terminal domain-containing protein [Paenibacillus sp. 1011MAR3C5]|uniref:BclA C-terminal domain-containing protein n=1 Tax=Paenibacillus sp. 1011MAR3C5 TaxID=1675787 RepID=UPI001601E797|nr:S-layer homology domain-containing protein [Paenibacillus sp. 1011MAR3C5]
MLYWKKVLASLTVLTMLMTLITGAAFAEGTKGFSDLSSVPWAQKDIDKMNLLEVVAGDASGAYNPNNLVSHQEAVSMTVRLLGLEQEEGAAESVLPLDVDAWAQASVQLALEHKLLVAAEETGSQWGKTGATREWTAKLIVRALEWKSDKTLSSVQKTTFSDAKNISAWAVKPVHAAVNAGLMSGFPDGSFKPGTTLTRAQMAVLLSNMLPQLIVGDESVGAGWNLGSGTIVTIEGQKLSLKNREGKLESYTLDKAATVYNYANKQVAISSLQAGDQISLVHKKGAAAFVEIKNGAPGAVGEQGPQGPQGPEGPSGSSGSKGPKGDTGAAGPAGTQGPKGDTGATGPAGAKGPKGDTGATGPAGTQGPKGDTGATGPAGAKGPKGDTGAAGPAGAPGPKGDTGAAGPAGAPGPKGDTGATGPAGVPGPKGDTGAAGPAGAPGPKGDTGAAGPAGPQGPKGDTGATGPAGPAGPQGPEGPTGATGPIGPAGPQGIQGEPGQDGAGITSYAYANASSTTIAVVLGGTAVPFPNNKVLNGVAISGDNTRFTVGETGTYFISYNVELTAPLLVNTGIYVNGAAIPGSRIEPSTGKSSFSKTMIAPLSAGSIVDLRLYGLLGVAVLNSNDGASITIMKIA